MKDRLTDCPARIRTAGPDDIARIEELERMIFSDAWSAASVESHMAGRANRALAAELPSGVTAGYLLGMCVLDEAEVYRVAVDPAFRGQGIGEALLDAFLAECMDGEDPANVSLEVRSRNLPAVRLYEKAGFRKTGLRKDYYRDPSDDGLLMRLER